MMELQNHRPSDVGHAKGRNLPRALKENNAYVNTMREKGKSLLVPCSPLVKIPPLSLEGKKEKYNVRTFYLVKII